MHPFVADTELNGSKYYEYKWPTAVSLNQLHNYWLSDNGENGTWCAFWFESNYSETFGPAACTSEPA